MKNTFTNSKETSKEKQPKNIKVQYLRAIAIIAVVLIHTCPSGSLQVICRPFINFAVATFLFLSGYLTKSEIENRQTFFKKRIIRVIIPYAIWTFLYTAASHIKNPAAIPVFTIKNLLTANAAAMMYYIFVYIQFVLLTPLLGKLAKSKYRWIGWCVAPISVMLKYYWVFCGVEPDPIVNLIWGDACLGWFTFYYLGLVLGNKIIERDYKLSKLFVIYIISIILQMLEGYVWLQYGQANCGTQIKLSSILTSSIFLLMAYTYIKGNSRQKETSEDCSSLLLIGNHSFGIYLCHIMFMRILSFVPYYREIPYVLNSTIVLFISLAFVYYGNKLCGKRLSKYFGFV